jgi:hypothetical protein
MAGGGFGEAALMSAVIGGGMSAAKGEDPLKGALLGGLLGGATGGIGNLLAPATAPAMAPGLGSALFGTAAEGALATPLAEGVLSTTVPAEFANAASGAQNLVNNAGSGVQLADAFGEESALRFLPQTAVENAIPMNTTAAAYPSGIMGGATPSSGGLGDLFSKFSALSTPEKLLYGGAAALAAPTVMGLFKGKKELGDDKEEYSGPLKKFKYDPSRYTPLKVTPPTPYRPVYTNYQNYAGGGTIEEMSNANAVGANTGYPMANIAPGAYATPYQQPISRNVLSDDSDTGVDPMTGEMRFAFGGFSGNLVNPRTGESIFKTPAQTKAAPPPPPTQFAATAARAPVARPVPYKARYAQGGISDLGGYSDGGRMLKGPGDGMSDNIPASIAGKQPARLANEEFVIPADVVSHLGNGSSEAGAKQLYKMMDRVRQARTGKKKQGKQINPEKYLA